MLMFLVVVCLILLVTVVPVMIAARVVGARRTSFGASLVALIVSALIVGVAVHMFRGGGLLMVILQYLFAALIAAILMFTALGSALHIKDMMRQVPIDTGPVQSV